MATIKKAAKGTCAPKASNVSSRLGSYGKKMKTGGSLGMKSVKAGFDKNPGVTRADIIVAGKGQAKKGMKVKKAQVGVSMDKKTKAKIEDSSKAREYQSKPVRKGASTTPIYIPRTSMKKGGKMGKCKYGCK